MAKRNMARRAEFWERMKKLLASDAECRSLDEALSKMAETPPRSLRLSRVRKSPQIASMDDLKALVEDQGFRCVRPIEWEKYGHWGDLGSVSQLSTHPVLGAGLLFIQEAGAMEAVNMLAPEPGDLVLDLAAAPGAKASQIGERLAGKGWLFANDPVKPRAERLDSLLARHGISNSSVYSIDPASLAERFPRAFDKILLDAPCSGESLFAKRTEKRMDVRDVDVKGCARRQFKILEHAAEMLRPGGRLLYSTCTYSREENEDIVEAFLQNNPDFSLLKDKRRWPHLDGVAGGYSALLEKSEDSGAKGFLSQAKMRETSGLIRHGSMRWNGERDLYVEAMSAFEKIPSIPSSPYEAECEGWSERPFVGELELSDAEAHAFLKGDALSLAGKAPLEKGYVLLKWKSFVLGYGKAVGDRVNNLLPKVLRGYESSDES